MGENKIWLWWGGRGFWVFGLEGTCMEGSYFKRGLMVHILREGRKSPLKNPKKEFFEIISKKLCVCFNLKFIKIKESRFLERKFDLNTKIKTLQNINKNWKTNHTHTFIYIHCLYIKILRLILFASSSNYLFLFFPVDSFTHYYFKN